MSDLVVRTRVAVAKRNLERIADLAEMMIRSQGTIKEFLDLPGELATKTKERQAKVIALRILALQSANDVQQLMEDLDALEKQLGQEVTHFTSVAQRAKELQTRFLVTTQERKDVATHLVKGSSEVANLLSVDTYWKQRERCDALFNEYVDLLRGIALRNAAFGDAEAWEINDLFAIADKLPGLWPEVDGWAWQSIAIPSRTERHASSEAMVLRIGFPEWTIWALPLIQHEFGYVFVKRKRLLLEGAPSLELACLADALATLMTGPAYACAELLLRLPLGPSQAALPGDLATADPDALEVAMRSATILAVLKREAKADPSLDLLVKRLEADWRAAIKQAAGSPSLFDRVTKDAAMKGVVDNTVNMARDAVLPLGPGGVRTPPFWATEWAGITQCAAALKNGSAAIDLSKPFAVASVLNAVWLARVAVDPMKDANDNEADAAAKEAIRLLTGTTGRSTTLGKGPAQA